MGGLLLMFASGCPHAYGIEGTVDQAMLKDLLDNASHEGCPEEELRDSCGDNFLRCMDDCQERMKRNTHP
jgi:microsomal dipeptidase-like Zn-dependent dipeptidase